MQHCTILYTLIQIDQFLYDSIILKYFYYGPKLSE